MCEFASLVLTEREELWIPRCANFPAPEVYRESHSEIMKYHGISEANVDGLRGIQILRAEIRPENCKRFEDFRSWTLRWDQDKFPEWFNDELDRERAYAALERRAKEGFAYVCVSHNPKLTSLTLPKAVTVDAYDNQNLISLDLQKAVTVYASYNPNLTSLTLPKAVTVDASHNPKLTSLTLPNAVKVHAHHNPELTSLTLPKAVKVHAHHNPKLVNKIGPWAECLL